MLIKVYLKTKIKHARTLKTILKMKGNKVVLTQQFIFIKLQLYTD